MFNPIYTFLVSPGVHYFKITIHINANIISYVSTAINTGIGNLEIIDTRGYLE